MFFFASSLLFISTSLHQSCFLFPFSVPSPLSPSFLISVSSFTVVHLLPCLFTPTLFPAVILVFLSFVFSVLLLSELSKRWADGDTDKHGGTHTDTHIYCMWKHSHSFACARVSIAHIVKLWKMDFHNYIHPHAHTVTYCVALPGRELFLGWVTLYNVCFSPPVVRRQIHGNSLCSPDYGISATWHHLFQRHA